MSSPTTPAPPSAPQHLDTMDVSASLEARPDEHGCETAAPGAGEGMGVVGVEVGDEVALCGTFFLAFLKEGASGYVIDERFLRTHLVVGFEIKRGQEREYLLASPLEPRTGKRLRATARMLKPVGSSGDRYALRRLAEAEYYHHWVRQAAGPGGRCTSHRNQPLEDGEPAELVPPVAGAECSSASDLPPQREDDDEVAVAPGPQGETDRGTPGETGARRSVMPSEGSAGARGSIPKPDPPEETGIGKRGVSRPQRAQEGRQASKSQAVAELGHPGRGIAGSTPAASSADEEERLRQLEPKMRSALRKLLDKSWPPDVADACGLRKVELLAWLWSRKTLDVPALRRLEVYWRRGPAAARRESAPKPEAVEYRKVDMEHLVEAGRVRMMPVEDEGPSLAERSAKLARQAKALADELQGTHRVMYGWCMVADELGVDRVDYRAMTGTYAGGRAREQDDPVWTPSEDEIERLEQAFPSVREKLFAWGAETSRLEAAQGELRAGLRRLAEQRGGRWVADQLGTSFEILTAAHLERTDDFAVFSHFRDTYAEIEQLLRDHLDAEPESDDAPVKSRAALAQALGVRVESIDVIHPFYDWLGEREVTAEQISHYREKIEEMGEDGYVAWRRARKEAVLAEQRDLEKAQDSLRQWGVRLRERLGLDQAAAVIGWDPEQVKSWLDDGAEPNAGERLLLEQVREFYEDAPTGLYQYTERVDTLRARMRVYCEGLGKKAVAQACGLSTSRLWGWVCRRHDLPVGRLLVIERVWREGLDGRESAPTQGVLL